MSFGKMPIANGFLTSDQIQNEYFFELAPAFCSYCGMFQLIEQPGQQKMFHENYAYQASTSKYMTSHFEKLSKEIQTSINFVIDIDITELLKEIQAKAIKTREEKKKEGKIQTTKNKNGCAKKITILKSFLKV